MLPYLEKESADKAKLSIFRRRNQTRLSNDAESNHKYPYKSKTEGDDRHRRGRGCTGGEAETAEMAW